MATRPTRRPPWLPPTELAAQVLSESNGSLQGVGKEVVLLHHGEVWHATEPWFGSELLTTTVWFSTWFHTLTARLDSAERTEFQLIMPPDTSEEEASRTADVYLTLLNLVREPLPKISTHEI